MFGPEPASEKIGALALLGVVLFNPPLLDVFDVGAEVTVVGVPLLFLYLFFAWAVLIGLMAFVIEGPALGGERPAAGQKETPPDAGPDAGPGAGQG